MELLYCGKVTPKSCKLTKGNATNKKLLAATDQFVSRRDLASQNNILTALTHKNPIFDSWSNRLISNTAKKYIEINICSLHEGIVTSFYTYLEERGYEKILINKFCDNLEVLSDKSNKEYKDIRENIKGLIDCRYKENITLLENSLDLVKNNATIFKQNYKTNLENITTAQKQLKECEVIKHLISSKLETLSLKGKVNKLTLESSEKLFAEIGYENWTSEIKTLWVNSTDKDIRLFSKEDAIKKFGELNKQIDIKIIEIATSIKIDEIERDNLNTALDEIIHNSALVIKNVNGYNISSWYAKLTNWIKNENAIDPFEGLNCDYVDELDKLIEGDSNSKWDNIEDWVSNVALHGGHFLQALSYIGSSIFIGGLIGYAAYALGLASIAFTGGAIIGGVIGIIAYKLILRTTKISLNSKLLPLTQIVENAHKANSALNDTFSKFNEFVEAKTTVTDSFKTDLHNHTTVYNEITEGQKKYSENLEKFVNSWVVQSNPEVLFAFLNYHVKQSLQKNTTDTQQFNELLRQIYTKFIIYESNTAYDSFKQHLKDRIESNPLDNLKLKELSAAIIEYFENHLNLGYKRDKDTCQILLNTLSLVELKNLDIGQSAKDELTNRNQNIQDLIKKIFAEWNSKVKISLINEENSEVKLLEFKSSKNNELNSKYSILTEKSKKLREQRNQLFKKTQAYSTNSIFADLSKLLDIKVVSKDEDSQPANTIKLVNSEIQTYNNAIDDFSKEVDEYNKNNELFKKLFELQSNVEQLAFDIKTQQLQYNNQVSQYNQLCKSFAINNIEKYEEISNISLVNVVHIFNIKLAELPSSHNVLEENKKQQLKFISSLKFEKIKLQQSSQKLYSYIQDELKNIFDTEISENISQSIVEFNNFMSNPLEDNSLVCHLMFKLYRAYEAYENKFPEQKSTTIPFDVDYLKNKICDYNLSEITLNKLTTAMNLFNKCLLQKQKYDELILKYGYELRNKLQKPELNNNNLPVTFLKLQEEIIQLIENDKLIDIKSKLTKINNNYSALDEFFNQTINIGEKLYTQQVNKLIDKFIEEADTYVLSTSKKNSYIMPQFTENKGLFDFNILIASEEQKANLRNIEDNPLFIDDNSYTQVPLTKTTGVSNSDSSLKLNSINNEPQKMTIEAYRNNLIEMLGQIELYGKLDLSSQSLAFPSPSNMAWFARALFHIKPIITNKMSEQLRIALKDNRYTSSNFKRIFEIEYYKAWHMQDFNKINEIRALTFELINEINLSLLTTTNSDILNYNIKNRIFEVFSVLWGSYFNQTQLVETQLKLHKSITKVLEKSDSDGVIADEIAFEKVIATFCENLNDKELLSNESSLRLLLDRTSTMLHYGFWLKSETKYSIDLKNSNLQQKSLENSLNSFIVTLNSFLSEINKRDNISKHEKNWLSYLTQLCNILVSSIDENPDSKSETIATSIKDNRIVFGKFKGIFGSIRQKIHNGINDFDKSKELCLIYESKHAINLKNPLANPNLQLNKPLLQNQLEELIKVVNSSKTDLFDLYKIMFDKLRNFTQQELVFPEEKDIINLRNKSLQISCMLAVFLKKYKHVINNKDVDNKFYRDILKKIFPKELFQASLVDKNGRRLLKIFAMTMQILEKNNTTKDDLWNSFNFSSINNTLMSKYMANNNASQYRNFLELCKLTQERIFRKDIEIEKQENKVLFRDISDTYKLSYLINNIILNNYNVF